MLITDFSEIPFLRTNCLLQNRTACHCEITQIDAVHKKIVFKLLCELLSVSDRNTVIFHFLHFCQFGESCRCRVRPHVLMLCPCVMLFFVVCLATLSLKVVIAGNVVRVMNGEYESIWKELVV